MLAEWRELYIEYAEMRHQIEAAEAFHLRKVFNTVRSAFTSHRERRIIEEQRLKQTGFGALFAYSGRRQEVKHLKQTAREFR